MEKRENTRVPLDSPLFISLCFENESSLPGILADMSRCGAQIILPPDGEHTPALEASVLILGLPEFFDVDGTGCSGRVSWISGGRCGIRLDQGIALSDEDLVKAARLL